MNGYANHYLNNQIATASKEQILLMLYDGAIRFSKMAKQAIEDGDMAAKGKYIGKTVAIIAEFASSLNHEIGGDIAANLDALYNFMIRELSTANVKNETGKIDTVCTMLCELRATWAEAIDINNGQQAADRPELETQFSVA
jgi:flagellar protein FliS